MRRCWLQGMPHSSSGVNGAGKESTSSARTSAARSGELPGLETALETAPPGGPLARRKSSLAATAPRCAAPNAAVKSAPACSTPGD